MDETKARKRRRPRPRPVFDQSVPSPCIQICKLDTKAICVGCYRSQDEIRDWMVMSREQKLVCLEKVKERRSGLEPQ